MIPALMLLALLAAAPDQTAPDPMTARDESDWTPHSAAALLDASFGNVEECQQQLDQARARVSHAPPVHGLSYARLFAQGRCEVEHPHGAAAGEPLWRIRMHWPRMRRVVAPPVKPAPPTLKR